MENNPRRWSEAISIQRTVVLSILMLATATQLDLLSRRKRPSYEARARRICACAVSGEQVDGIAGWRKHFCRRHLLERNPMDSAALLRMRFETLAVRAGSERDGTGAIAPPLHLSTNYEHGPAGEHLHDYIYTRVDNPTQRRLETALAAVEGGEAALVFASGVAAGAAYFQSLPQGSHVLFADDLFYGFRSMAPSFFPRWGITWSSVDMADLTAVRGAIRPETRVLWTETPSNPLMKIVDIASLADIAHSAHARLLVDSTFPTPALLRPLALGADLTLHSTTKYLGGHSDVQGGALIFARNGDSFLEIKQIRTSLGSVASPFSSWLVLRGLRTLAARMRMHSANAREVATALSANKQVNQVLYPGLSTQPGHDIAAAQMTDFGGMLSIRVQGGAERAIKVASRTKIFVNAGSLGGPESLIQHAASVMHPAGSIPGDLLRLSIGLEHPQDLIADLESALN
jgi:cystathionine gamma-synthase